MKKLLISLFTIVAISVIAIICATSASAATSGTTGECEWTLDGTVLTISGNGKMADYRSSHANPWGHKISKIIIEPGVTHIGNYAFDGLVEIKNITLPEGIKSIGHGAFESCLNLESIKLPNSLTALGYRSFALCVNLSNVTFGEGISIIEELAFTNCESLRILYIPDNITTIRDGAFAECTRLTSVIIGKGTTDLSRSAFEYCRNIKKVYIASSIVVNAFDSRDEFGYLFYNANSIYIEKSILGINQYIKSHYPCSGSSQQYLDKTYTVYNADHYFDDIYDATCNSCGHTRDVETTIIPNTDPLPTETTEHVTSPTPIPVRQAPLTTTVVTVWTPLF